MSFRELRNVSEQLREIGYRKLVSLESFRNPNFKLVEDIIRWFILRYDQESDLFGLSGTETEQQRVVFIRGFVELMRKKANVKLNPKRLYQSDGYSAKELLKVINWLNDAVSAPKTHNKTETRDELTIFYGAQPSLTKIRKVRDLASKLTEKGVNLFDLLSKEINLRLTRETVLNKPIELKDYEQHLQSAISSLKQEQTKLFQSIESGETTIHSIDIKIQKKESDLERNNQRWETMSRVRPAYMDDYERVQKELENVYADYVGRFRVLCALRYQMDEINRVDEIKRNQERIAREEMVSIADEDEDGAEELIFIPEPIKGGCRGGGILPYGPRSALLSGSEEDDDEEDSVLDDSIAQNARDFLISRSGSINKMSRPQGTARNEMSLGGTTSRVMTGIDTESRRVGTGIGNSKKTPQNPRQVFGSMLGNGDDDESDSDILLLEGENQDDGDDDDENSDDLGSGSEVELDNELMGRGVQRKKINNDHHQLRRDMNKTNPSANLTMLNGNLVGAGINPHHHRQPPPAPTTSVANSATNLDEQLLLSRNPDTDDDSIMPNGRPGGGLKPGSEVGGAGDSLTKPLEPEPRYTLTPGDADEDDPGRQLISSKGRQQPRKKYVPPPVQGHARPLSRPGTGQMKPGGSRSGLQPEDEEF